jgi:hypothetical protein
MAAVSSPLQGMLFGRQGLRLPVRKFIKMARISEIDGTAVTKEDVASRKYKHEEAGGYSIHVQVVFKVLAVEGIERLPVDNLMVVLSPCEVGEKSVRDVDINGTNVKVMRTNAVVDDCRGVIVLKAMWIPFAGKGEPPDTLHTVPSITAAEEQGQIQGCLRLLMARGVLKTSRDSKVGWYVLYCGRGRQLGQERRWLEGIVLSTQESSAASSGTMMCEVLYVNGWVIWHDAATITGKRSANIQWFEKFDDMMKMSRGWDREKWLQNARMFDHLKSGPKQKENLKQLGEELFDMYS